MRYLSVCSGIEAASVAWHDLGWTPLAFAEIEPFPRAVLAHRFPGVPLHGDFTKLRDEPWIVDADLLVGGTPCQAFSVAGLRGSLSDERGNLTLEFVRLANAVDDLRRAAGRAPAFVVWENVPGVLSVADNAFGAFLGGLVGHDAAIEPPAGRGWSNAGVVSGPRRCAAWRILDAQHFGVPQRRRRVFVTAVGHPRGWAAADALLPVIESMRWHPAPRREAGEEIARSLTSRASGGGGGPGAGTDEACAGYIQPVVRWPADVAPTLNAAFGEKQGLEDQHALGGAGLFVPTVAGALTAKGPEAMGAPEVDGGYYVVSSGQANASITRGIAPTLDCLHEAPLVAHTLRGEGFDASEDGTGRGTPLVPVCFDPTAGRDMRAYQDGTAPGLKVGSGIGIPWSPAIAFQGRGTNIEFGKDVAGTLGTNIDRASGAAPCIAFSAKDHGADAGDTAPTLRAMGHAGSHPNGGGQVAVATSSGRGWWNDSGTAATIRAQDSVTKADTLAVHAMQVRRLTPTECERLQGFPDGWTAIPWRGKPASECPDGPRYKALGNSMAVPCMRYIAERIEAVTQALR